MYFSDLPDVDTVGLCSNLLDVLTFGKITNAFEAFMFNVTPDKFIALYKIV